MYIWVVLVVDIDVMVHSEMLKYLFDCRFLSKELHLSEYGINTIYSASSLLIWIFCEYHDFSKIVHIIVMIVFLSF